ncbi:four-carbon acid sugar kinase family protein (plasmid) [Ensifer adhaerens]|uniref:3-oxo-tetronate kinase n=1 Tax=Ensifer adhaerens TaxID=106592 RepID=UPI00210076AF|nr:3-oxo-tetronate kinase [Ensifer adhaerens]UTV41852.1 four-carbon acid sugar kinase family protein [Ensifer adhaerens]
MLIGAIGDDFTGSADLANMIAQAGLPTRLYADQLPASATDEAAAIVALKTRSVPAAEAIAASRAAVDWLLRQGAEHILFKYCSTFDSTPEGNIGPVAEALADDLGADRVLFVPSFPSTGRTVYQGHLFVGDRLLSESPLAQHPLTPMTDPDLRRWLARQTSQTVGHLPLAVLRAENAAAALAEADARFIIADAIDDGDIDRLGRLVRDARLVTGGSAIGSGLARALGAEGMARGRWTGVGGRAVLLAGSCSAATLGQIAAYDGPQRRLSVTEALSADEAFIQTLAAWVLQQDRPPLIAASSPAADVTAAQETYGRNRVATAIEDTFARLAAALRAHGVLRFVVAGGETSGAVATGLGITSFEVGPQIAPGVPALAAGPLRVALKSGNFGGRDFFRRALEVLEGR